MDNPIDMGILECLLRSLVHTNQRKHSRVAGRCRRNRDKFVRGNAAVGCFDVNKRIKTVLNPFLTLDIVFVGFRVAALVALTKVRLTLLTSRWTVTLARTRVQAVCQINSTVEFTA